MEGFQKWWGALDRARKIMLIALGLMTLSHFGDYVAPYSRETPVEAFGMVTPNGTLGGSTFSAGTPMPGESGWSVHPYAWLVLGALLLLFAANLDLGAWWKKWGYWIAVAGMVFCLFPLDTENLPGYGFYAGLVAVGIGVWAARARGATAA